MDSAHGFFLGTHQVDWLGKYAVPMMVSRVRLHTRKSLPRALAPVTIDSGGFSELSLHGRWTVDARTYAAEVRRYVDEIGSVKWAAIQDWMCEEQILAKTGKSVKEHQELTVQSYEDLLALDPTLPWLPVLQGWTRGQYLDHVELYARRGHDLTKLPTVGIGSVCRRQQTLNASITVKWLASDGLRLHGFGFKTQGLMTCAPWLASSDSLAWSFDARHQPKDPRCTHARCTSCPQYALEWREQLLERLEREHGTRCELRAA